jgi:hypothetical protein
MFTDMVSDSNSAPQSADLFQCGAQYPAGQWLDEPGLLGDRQERGRRHQPALWVLPPDQRLHRAHLAGPYPGLGLVVQHQLATVDGAAQLGDQRQLAAS